MRAKRVYNNNVVLAKNQQEEEVILIGRGLAYGLKKGDIVDEKLIEKKFELKKPVHHKFKELIQDISVDDILICEEVISYIKNHSKKELDDSIYVTLTDHIVNMADRIRKGIDFDSTILLNVKIMYKDEYQLALEALDILRKKLDLRIADTEANFITLHIINAEMHSNMMQMYEITNIIDEIIVIVNNSFDIKTKDNYAYDRFITHCRFFVQRVVNKEHLETDSSAYDKMLPVIKDQYAKQNICVGKIADFIEKKYSYRVEDDEKMYILLHLVRLTK